MYEYCVYPAILKKKCLKTSIVLIPFNDVFCDISVHTVTVSHRRFILSRYQKSYILVSDPI